MLNITACGYLAADPRSNTVGQTDVTNLRLLVNKKIKDRNMSPQWSAQCGALGQL